MNSLIILKRKLDTIKKRGWIACTVKNYGSVGLKLEQLLGINTLNLEIPDFEGIELKTKKSKFKQTISLFSATPDNQLFEIKRLHKLYAYSDKKNPEYNVLNKILKQGELTYIYNEIFFTLKVDYNKKVIFLVILNRNLEIIDCTTYWSFDLLRDKLERKLRYMCYIQADTVYSNSQLYVKYKDENYYKLKSFDTFLNLIEKGKISITFRIGVYKYGKKIGQIHDHGTTFSIDEMNIEDLFEKITIND